MRFKYITEFWVHSRNTSRKQSGRIPSSCHKTTQQQGNVVALQNLMLTYADTHIVGITSHYCKNKGIIIACKIVQITVTLFCITSYGIIQAEGFLYYEDGTDG